MLLPVLKLQGNAIYWEWRKQCLAASAENGPKHYGLSSQTHVTDPIKQSSNSLGTTIRVFITLKTQHIFQICPVPFFSVPQQFSLPCFQ